METHGPKLLGTAYKDPITSFDLFRQFTMEHPEVSVLAAILLDHILFYNHSSMCVPF